MADSDIFSPSLYYTSPKVFKKETAACFQVSQHQQRIYEYRRTICRWPWHPRSSPNGIPSHQPQHAPSPTYELKGGRQPFKTNHMIWCTKERNPSSDNPLVSRLFKKTNYFESNILQKLNTAYNFSFFLSLYYSLYQIIELYNEELFIYLFAFFTFQTFS